MGNFWADFLRGVGSILDLSGKAFIDEKPMYYKHIHEEDALRGDLEKVENDIAKAFSQEID